MGILSYLLIIYAVFVFENTDGLACFECRSATKIQECQNRTVTCKSGEKCFLEWSRRQGDLIDAGCRSKDICNIMSFSTLPQDYCHRCCSTSDTAHVPCNIGLCDNAFGGPICLSCTNTYSANTCQQNQVCQDTQVCANEIVIEGSLIRHNFYCEEKHFCAAFYGNMIQSNHNRKRDAHGHSPGISVCNSCCHGFECNKQDCVFLAKNYTAKDFAPMVG